MVVGLEGTWKSPGQTLRLHHQQSHPGHLHCCAIPGPSFLSTAWPPQVLVPGQGEWPPHWPVPYPLPVQLGPVPDSLPKRTRGRQPVVGVQTQTSTFLVCCCHATSNAQNRVPKSGTKIHLIMMHFYLQTHVWAHRMDTNIRTSMYLCLTS